MDLFTEAQSLGILTEFVDGQGQRHVTGEAALRIIVDALPAGSSWRFVEGSVVMRSGRPARTNLTPAVKSPLRWQIVAGDETVAEGESRDDKIEWPDNLPVGAYRVLLTDSSQSQETVPLIVAPPSAFDGDFDRGWLLAVQLYGVRSARNWGIGDFSDLEGLIELAGQLGADGVGLNPLHALFDDRPGDCSPYSPNSRLFLNPLYIDVEKIPEHHRDTSADVLERLRGSSMVDYAGVAALKWRALRAAYDAFSASADAARRREFDSFRAEPARSCFASPASRCSDTVSRRPGGNGRSHGDGPTRRRASNCARGQSGARSSSSSSCNGRPTGSCNPARRLRTNSA